MADTPLFVARPSDVAVLRRHFDDAAGGKGRTVSLRAPVGGGKRALVGEFVRSLTDFDGVVWRVAFVEEEEGIRTLLRLYATLYAALGEDLLKRGRAEMILNSQLPKQTQRVQRWYQAFIEGLKKGQKRDEKGGFQVSLPRDNPAVGLVEIVRGLSTRMPIVLEIQNAQACQSVVVNGLLEALSTSTADRQMLTILSTMDLSEKNRAWMPAPLLDFLDRKADAMEVLELAPWGEDEVKQYLASKELGGDAAQLARIADGRPGYIAELVEILAEEGRLEGDLSDVNLANLYPRGVDEDELEEEEHEDGRKHAMPQHLEDIAYRAALLGRAFPSNLVADIGGYDRDSIDDLLDASELFDELQFSEPMKTWIYQFKKACYREGALDQARTDAEQAATVARDTAAFLERFLVPRAYDFVVKTARIYAEANEPARAAVLRSMALSADRPEAWAMSFDMMKHFASVGWPDAMRRTVYMNYVDRMVVNGPVDQAEQLFNEVMAWADAQDDRRLKAWLLYAGSRLDLRRQDHYRARDRAKDALTLYRGLEDRLNIAEVQNHLAMVELSDGNPTAALELVEGALKEGSLETKDGKRAVLPQVAARSEYIRGLVNKRERKFKEAADYFRRANDIAGRTGQAPLALEAGLNFGEMLLVSGDATQAADVLQRVLQIAVALNDPLRQRASASLLAQSHGALKNFDAALNWAKQTLNATQQLKLERLIPIDTFNVGRFSMAVGKSTEALALFRKARSEANLQQDVNFARELHFALGNAALQAGETGDAKAAFSALLPAARQTRDLGKFVRGSEQLARIHAAEGDKSRARSVLDEALKVAEEANMKDARRNVKKLMDELT